MRRHRVLIADDHRLMLEAIRIAFEDVSDFEIVGMASGGAELLPLLARTGADLVLLDLRMPGMDGLACLELIKKRYPKVITVVLSGIDDPKVVQSAFRRGAVAFIMKHIDPRDLVSAVRQAIDGTVCQTFGAPAGAEQAAGAQIGLSERELTILAQVANGRSNKEIALELYLAEQTVKFHLSNSYRKLGVGTRTEAVREAYRRGLLEAPLLEQALSG